MQEGATLKYGGKRSGDEGYFVQPTIFADVTDEMTIAKQEVNFDFTIFIVSFINSIVISVLRLFGNLKEHFYPHFAVLFLSTYITIRNNNDNNY